MKTLKNAEQSSTKNMEFNMKKSRKQIANETHEKFLRRMGCTSKDIAKKKSRKSVNDFPNLKVDSENSKYQSSNEFGNCFKNSIEDKMLRTNDPGLKEFYVKKSRIAPAYNKGGLQYTVEKAYK